MKSKRRKRVIASVLCMVLMLSTGMSTLAEADAGTVPAVEETTAAQTTAQETKSTSTDAQTAETETQTQTETENQTETKQTEEAAQTQPEETTAVQPTEEASGGETTQTETDQTAQNTQDQTTSAETSGTETQNETVETQPEETETTTPAEETQEMKEEAGVSPAFNETYENSEVTVKVTADEGIVPEGAKLSVTPIVKKEITDQMSEEEKAEAKKINDQYDLTEKKLSEDSDKNKEIMEGFLAYDISFLVDGKEVEPSGDVKVVIDFKKAAAPEGVSEDADVAVKHLKEDVTAEDGVAVENMAEKADVQTTNKVEVEKVELTTDSFSTYTITWSEDEHKDTLTIKVVDAYGEPIGNSVGLFGRNDFNWEGENTVTVDNILQKLIDKINDSYVTWNNFNKAVYGKDGEFSFSAPTIEAFKYKSSEDTYEFRYNPADSENSWRSIGENDVIYFIFGDAPELSFSPISTVSTRDTIDINLFDYQVGGDGDESAGWSNSEGINNGHALKFVDNKGSDNHTVNINQDGSSGKINSGMVENKLVDGYPKLSKDKTEKVELLDYLFDLRETNNVKKVYSGLDKLFTIDQEGYHVFNSDQHYAYLKNNGSSFAKEFTVGNIEGQNSPGFYPFSQPTSSTIADIKKSSDEATLGYTGVNHYYGMTIETSFIQPKGGKINNNQDMIFEFSGDDDVWVFIDDVLVLDLGGIHGKVSGTINFANGEVTRTDIKGSEALGTTLKKAFDKAGVNVELESTGGFADYSTHTIKFFYLERGNFDSNCMIKFNFPTIPKDSVAVAKEVTDEDGNGIDYADDIDFKFNIKVDASNYANREYALWKNGEEVVDEDGKPVTGTTDSDGNFTLKHSEMAVFSNISADAQYQVTELGAYLNGYTVYIDGTEHEVNPDSPSGITVPSVQTDMLTVGEEQSVVFRNEIKNRATLNIKKQLAEGENPTEKEFQIKLKIQGVEYDGTYSIGDQSGLQANDGIIVLRANQTATITGLPYGVSFEVEEMLDGSYLPAYSISDHGFYDVTIPSEDNDQNAVTGKINSDGTVTVTNSKVDVSDGTTSVTVTKTWAEEGKYSDLIPNYIYVTLYEDINRNQSYDEEDKPVTKDALGNPIAADVKLTADGWTHTWSNLPADTDFVIKETYPEGFEWKTTEYSNSLSNLKKLGRVTSCKNTSFNLGKNNMLLVKNTSNDGYFLWSVYDLKLTDAQIREIAADIKNMGLEGSGSLDVDNLSYDWGITSDDTGITLTQNDEGWNLKFDGTSVWSQFWNFQYDRVENISLVNQIDHDLETEVTVAKSWGNYQGDSVEVKLVPTVDGDKTLTEEDIEWDGSFIVTLNENNEWKCAYQNLPFYYYDSSEGKYKEINYSVTELSVTVNGEKKELESGKISPEGYLFDVTTNTENNFIITNNKISEWELVKVSSTGDSIHLEGAEFTLTEKDKNEPKYYGKSDNEGVVKWYTDSSMTGTPEQYLDDGVYYLKETKAPDGYQRSDEIWVLTIDEYQLESITKKDGGADISQMDQNANSIIRYAYVNIPLYELPSSGGPGIFLYTIGGVLLLMAGSLILYKMKREEVLKK